MTLEAGYLISQSLDVLFLQSQLFLLVSDLLLLLRHLLLQKDDLLVLLSNDCEYGAHQRCALVKRDRWKT